MIDSKNLYEWAFNNLSMKDVLNSEDAVGEITLKYAWNKDKILLVPAKNYSTIMPDSVDVSSIILTKQDVYKRQYPVSPDPRSQIPHR